MPENFRITLAQLNPTVGDLPGNAAKARAAWEQARAAGSAMLVLPEMFITGYQTQDLVLKRAFTEDAMAEIEKLARDCADGPVIGIGGPYAEGKKLFNAFWILQHGKVVTRVLKHDLPRQRGFHQRAAVAHPFAGDVVPTRPFQVGEVGFGGEAAVDDGDHSAQAPVPHAVLHLREDGDVGGVAGPAPTPHRDAFLRDGQADDDLGQEQ